MLPSCVSRRHLDSVKRCDVAAIPLPELTHMSVGRARFGVNSRGPNQVPPMSQARALACLCVRSCGSSKMMAMNQSRVAVSE